MDKLLYDELMKEDNEEKNKGLQPNQRLNKLADILKKRLDSKDINRTQKINDMVIFYDYILENYGEFYANQYKDKSFQKAVCDFYTKENIDENLDKIISDKKFLKAFISLSDDTLINNLIMVAYEKSDSDALDSIKEVCEVMNISPKAFDDIRNLQIKKEIDEDINKDIQNDVVNSVAANNLLNVIADTEKVIDAGSYDVSLDGDKLSSDHERRVNEAMEKINQMVLERGIDDTKEPVINIPDKREPEVSTNYLNNNDNIFNNPTPISSADYENQRKAYDEQILNLKLRQRELDRKENERVNGVFENAANEIGMEGSLLRSQAEKSGIDTSKIDKISISEDMSQMVANGVSVTLPKTRFNTFIENLFMKQKLKSIEMSVEEIDNQKVLKTSSTMRFDKIASCENAVIKSIEKACERKAKCKKLFIDTKNNVLKAIKELAIKSIEKVEDVKDRVSDINYDVRQNISNRLMDVADRISPEYYNPYDVTGRVELNNDEPIVKPVRKSEEDKEVDDILEEIQKRKEYFDKNGMSEESMLELLKNNNVTGVSGTPITKLPALNEENQMKM